MFLLNIINTGAISNASGMNILIAALIGLSFSAVGFYFRHVVRNSELWKLYNKPNKTREDWVHLIRMSITAALMWGVTTVVVGIVSLFILISAG